MNAFTYAASGVDIDAAEQFVALIKGRVSAAWPQASIGGFAGSLQLQQPTRRIVGCADGSGTMAILAALTDRFEVIGQNAAAMSLIDAYVTGAMPVGLLDVIDVAKLEPRKHIAIIDGLITSCKRAGSCRLIGGETAELPGMFRHEWMVNVNTSILAVPQDNIVTGNVE